MKFVKSFIQQRETQDDNDEDEDQADEAGGSSDEEIDACENLNSEL